MPEERNRNGGNHRGGQWYGVGRQAAMGSGMRMFPPGEVMRGPGMGPMNVEGPGGSSGALVPAGAGTVFRGPMGPGAMRPGGFGFPRVAPNNKMPQLFAI